MHIFLKKPIVAICPKCGNKVLPHRVCLNCGYYKGKLVIDVLEKLNKKERKRREKEMAAKEKEETKPKEMSMEEMSKR